LNDVPELLTGYDLPFVVSLGEGPLLASGGTVHVDLGRANGSADTAPAQELLARFVRLARTGAFGSSLVPPQRSGVGGFFVSGSVATLTECRVDERAALILVNLFLARRRAFPLKGLTLRSGPHTRLRRLPYEPEAECTYPDHPEDLPFEFIDEDPSGDSRTITAEFEREIGLPEEAHLGQAYEAWTDVLLAGGYGVPPVPPEESYAEPAAPAAWGSGYELAVAKLRVAPESIHALVNVFVAFHHRLCRVTSLTIG
jgi:hypothetical protein